MAPLRIHAPAKLNLFLHITGKRADGYHLIESLAVFTEFGDRVEVADAQELSLAIEGPFANLLQGDGNTNLVMRAARALQRYAGVTRGAAIVLHKHIPMGAGLGGGSSDAAATLRGLVQLWHLSLSEDELLKLALSLGSDVPVCMSGKSAWMSGVGEHIKPADLSLREAWLVLVNPNVELLTVDVYRRFAGGFSASVAPAEDVKMLSQLVDLMGARGNDLEKPAIVLLPVIADILECLRATKGCAIARMSGSGATCFALYDNQQAAQAAVQQIQNAQPNWWTQVTTLLGN